MSLFPRSIVSNDSTSTFHPLFRLLDDFDNYSSGNDSGSSRQGRSGLKVFAPKFDVRELPESYELHGELPGIEQKDVEIEFTDSQTLTIRGHTERSYTSGTPPSGAIEGGPTSSGAITEGENGAGTKAQTKNAKDKDTTKKSSGDVATQGDKSAEQEVKYWVSERSIGDFSRTFTFPARVDQDNVRASIKNGILSVVVPKSKKPESRKITIS